MELEGARDVRLVEQCLRNPQWQIPPDLYKYLPAALTEIVSKQETKDGVTRYKYSVRSRTVATRLLLQMHGQNQAEKPPPQEVNVHVQSDVATAIDQLGQLSDDQLEQIIRANQLIRSVKPPEPPKS